MASMSVVNNYVLEELIFATRKSYLTVESRRTHTRPRDRVRTRDRSHTHVRWRRQMTMGVKRFRTEFFSIAVICWLHVAKSTDTLGVCSGRTGAAMERRWGYLALRVVVKLAITFLRKGHNLNVAISHRMPRFDVSYSAFYNEQ